MPHKFGFIEKFRSFSDYWLIRMPIPNINPSLISVLGFPLSLAFVLLWDNNKLIAFIALALALIVDWLDGIVAKKYNRQSEKGWLIDTGVDKISELIIFLKFFNPWFYLFLINLLITYLNIRYKRFKIALALRQYFFLYLIFLYTFYYFLSR